MRVNPAPGLFLPAHGVIDDLYRFSVDGRVVDSVQDLLEFVVLLVLFHTEAKGLLDIFQIFDRFRAKGCFDLLEEQLQ